MIEFAEEYLKILKTDLAGINLTRILDFKEFYEKQILDSVIVQEQSKIFEEKLKETKILIDVGFGGGFPLVPLAFKNQGRVNLHFVGIEAREKKIEAVKKIVEHFKLKNIKFIHARLEKIHFDKEAVLTFKAVGEVKKILSSIFASKKLFVFFYKGPNVSQKEDLYTMPKGWKMIENLELNLEGVDGRRFLGFEYVPCGTTLNCTRLKNSLVKVSDLI